nr:MAG: antirepressor protein KilAC domain protein [Bacteriophage sp.]
MNTEIQTFNFNNATMRTLTDTAGDPWFVLKDCMSILGLSNPTETAKMFDDDEFSTTEVIDSIGRRQQTYIISEAGLYGLVLKSRKPEAKEFKRWVTHEVLPTIRKTGGYIPATEADSDEDILAKAVLIAQKTIDLKNQQLRAKDAQIKELEPKAQALDAFTEIEDRLLVRDAAKILSNAGIPVSEKQLREWMTANDWIYKHNGSWHATAKHCTAGHLVMVMSTKHGTKADGTKFAFPPTVRITRKGLALLHKRLGEDLLANALETTTH